jgi:hypothetical protein
MIDFSLQLSELLTQHENFNFRMGEEDIFPWGHNETGVWYALLVWEGIELNRYGFSSSKTSKGELIETLMLIKQENKKHFLVGVWTGEWTTHLHILNTDIALEEISWRQDMTAKQLAESEALRERRLAKKSLEPKVKLERPKPSSATSSFAPEIDFSELLRGLNEGKSNQDLPSEESDEDFLDK